MDVELIQQINDQLREMNDMMGRQASAMSSHIKSINQSTVAANNQAAANNNLNTAQKAVGSQSTEQTKLSEISRQATIKTTSATDQLTTSLSKGKSAFFGLAGALLDVTPGFSKYSSGIESATDAVAGVTSIFGPLGAAAGFLLKGFSLLIGQTLKYNDNIVDAYDAVAKAGAGIGLSAENIVQLGRNAKLSSGTLTYLTKNVEALGSDLRALGGSASAGTEKFAQMIAVGDTNLKQYRNLGYTQEELITSMGTYVKLQSMAGADLKKSPEQLQKASLQYLDELNAFAEVTGINKKKQEEALEKALAQENFNAYITRLNSDLAKTSDAEERARLEAEIKAKTNFGKYVSATYKGAKATALLEAASSRTGAIMSGDIAKLKSAGIDIQGITKNLSNGIDQVGELRKQDAESANQFQKNFGVLATGVGQESRNLNDQFFQDNETRMAAAQYNAEKEGKNQVAYDQKTQAAMKQQEAVKKKIDGLTAQKGEIEKQERDIRLAFDDVLNQMSPLLNSFLKSALPWITGTISFVTKHFDSIALAAKVLAGFFVSLGAVIVGGKILGAISSVGSKVAGLFGKRTGTLGSSTNPMYVDFEGGGGAGGGAGKKGKQGKFGRFARGAGKLALGGATIAAAGWMASSAVDAFEDDSLSDVNDIGGDALKAAGIDTSSPNSKTEQSAGPSDKSDPAKMEQTLKILKELGKANIDPKRVEANSQAIVALPKALGTLPENASGADLSALSNIVGDSALLEDFAYFSNKINLDPKQTKKNSEAFKYFSDAMASFKGIGSPIGVIGSALADASVKFFKAKPPMDEFTYFSKLSINLDRTKNNASAFVKFSEAMASYKGGQGLLSAVSTIAAAKLNSLFGQDSAIDSFVKFSEKPFGKYGEVNSKAFLQFSKAMNILSGGDSSVLGDLANAAVTVGSAVVGAVAGAATVVGNFFKGDAGTQQGQEVRIGNEVRKGGTVSWRTNNPGNVSYGGLSKSYGAVGRWIKPDGDKQQRTTGIAIMPTYEHGLKLKMGLWRRPMYQPLTMAEGVSQWVTGKARPVAPHTASYAKDMARAAGVSVDHPISKLTDSQLRAAAIKQEKWEGFKSGTIAQARAGGLFKGPTGGYPIELHGTELVIPVTPDSILSKLAEGTVDSEKMTNEILDTVTGMLNGDAPASEVDQFLELDNQMKGMLITKFNRMLDILDDKQGTSKKMFRSKVAG